MSWVEGTGQRIVKAEADIDRNTEEQWERDLFVCVRERERERERVCLCV